MTTAATKETASNVRIATLTDTDGQEHTYTLTYMQASMGWRVQGDGLDQFVSFRFVGFPTATSIVVAAYAQADSTAAEATDQEACLVCGDVATVRCDDRWLCNDCNVAEGGGR